MRPELTLNINPEEFLKYYWLKEELIKFSKKYKIPCNDSKDEITDRIYIYLKTGNIIQPTKHNTTKIRGDNSEITIYSIIPEGYKSDEKNRSFFISEIGETFKFNVPFMNWMKVNSGKLYSEAIEEYKKIILNKMNGKKNKIPSQFQYNQYTRDFFNANLKASREDAIKCWKYKKSLRGHNKYEEKDLIILDK